LGDRVSEMSDQRLVDVGNTKGHGQAPVMTSGVGVTLVNTW
jgi:hypothetical protein